MCFYLLQVNIMFLMLFAKNFQELFIIVTLFNDCIGNKS